VHAGGVEVVVVHRPARRPPARRDHRGGGVQRLPLEAVELGGALGGQPGLVGERQVQQDRQAQPPGVRHDGLGHPTGDESVQKHDGPVRKLVECSVEGGPRLPVGGGPAAGHGDLTQPEHLAHPAVVGIAAARERHVVDVRGQHERCRVGAHLGDHSARL
jgi:hypothetical protein